MALELVDASEIKKDDDIKIDAEKDKKDGKDKNDGKDKKDGIKEKGLRLLQKGDVISCERVKIGIVNNCALCEITNNEIFVRCPNKWKF